MDPAHDIRELSVVSTPPANRLMRGVLAQSAVADKGQLLVPRAQRMAKELQEGKLFEKLEVMEPSERRLELMKLGFSPEVCDKAECRLAQDDGARPTSTRRPTSVVRRDPPAHAHTDPLAPSPHPEHARAN